jgi:hypothetical protein
VFVLARNTVASIHWWWLARGVVSRGRAMPMRHAFAEQDQLRQAAVLDVACSEGDEAGFGHRLAVLNGSSKWV